MVINCKLETSYSGGNILYIINPLCLSVAGAHKIGHNLKGGSVGSWTCAPTPYSLGKA